MLKLLITRTTPFRDRRPQVQQSARIEQVDDLQLGLLSNPDTDSLNDPDQQHVTLRQSRTVSRAAEKVSIDTLQSRVTAIDDRLDTVRQAPRSQSDIL